MRSTRSLIKAAAAATLCLAALGAAPQAAFADHTQESIFQDDQYLLDSSTPVVEQTLATLRTLGVQRIRINVLWSSIAPDPLSRQPPAHFAATDPNAYPAGAWAPYDRIVDLAALSGMGVDFTVTAPGPLWAMAKHPVSTRAANHWSPNALDFYDFMAAIGLRYSGIFHPSPYTASSDATTVSHSASSPSAPSRGALTLPINLLGLGGSSTPSAAATSPAIPAVTYWAIWNEPDQPGWLSPQWRKYKRHWVMNSPRLYREYVDAAYLGLGLTGHTTATNTILIGELAPEGDTTPGAYVATTPLPFLRDLYCVNRHYKPLRGSAAVALGCHKNGSRTAFVKDNPLLFSATGWAHHPYYFFHTPSYNTPDQDFAPLGNTARLGRALNRVFRAYGVKRSIPIYFTEYGYETNPPDPHRPITLAQQATYLNEADYIAWKNSRVRSVAQFLLYDSPPNTAYPPSDPAYWQTFQTGLLFANGKRKPSFDAYRMPIWIPDPRFRRGSRTFIWGDLRGAPHTSTQTAIIQWRPRHGGNWSTIASVPVTNPDGYFTANVKIPGTGLVRSEWLPPAGGHEASRSVDVTRR